MPIAIGSQVGLLPQAQPLLAIGIDPMFTIWAVVGDALNNELSITVTVSREAVQLARVGYLMRNELQTSCAVTGFPSWNFKSLLIWNLILFAAGEYQLYVIQFNTWQLA
jgi:hypothetical protein